MPPLPGPERRHQPARRLESSYPFVHELRSQFRDLDPLRHVNNVAVAAYYEDARAYFVRHTLGRTREVDGETSRGAGGEIGREVGGEIGWETGPFEFLVASVEIDYLGVAHHPRAFRIGAGIHRIGTSSLTVSQALFSEGACIGLCDTTMVCMGADGPRPLSTEQRRRLAGAMVGFAVPISEAVSEDAVR